jgi:spermidine/putrescine transport system substrate-binding protein
VQGAQDEMTKIDPDLATNPLIFPDARRSPRRTASCRSPSSSGPLYQQKFQQVIGA